jgi:hypothetical protein
MTDKQLLEQSEQEPRGYQWLDTAVFRKKLPDNAEPDAWHALYTTPPAAQPAPVQEPVAWRVPGYADTAYTAGTPSDGDIAYWRDQGVELELAYGAPPAAQPAAVQEQVAAELERIAEEPPVNGNNLAQARVLMAVQRIRNSTPPAQPAPPECQTEAEKTAFAFGWWKALESVRQTAPVKEPALKPLSKKWKWVLHESFADVAGFDEEGFPSFYWKESVTKFKSGELSVPCKGKNCGSLNGWLHSAECRAEHEAQYTTPPTAQRQWAGLTDDEIESTFHEVDDCGIGLSNLCRAIEAKLKEKNNG